MKHSSQSAAVAVFVLVMALALPANAQLLTFGPGHNMSVSARPSGDNDLWLTIGNEGPVEAQGALTAVLPEGLAVLDVPVGCAQEGRRVRCQSRPLRPGASTTFPIEVVPTARGPQRVDVTLTGSNPADTDGSDNAASTVIRTLPTPSASADVIESSVAVSRLRFPGQASRAVLARSDAFADALAASPLTAAGPLLYSDGAALDPRVAAELERVLPVGSTVDLMGGEAALGTAVADELVARGYAVNRIAGSSRFATALSAADAVVARDGAVDTVIVALGEGVGSGAWADAVASGGLSASQGIPVILTRGDSLPDGVLGWLAAHGVTRTFVIGGTAAISDGVAALLPGVERIAGPDRAATAMSIAGRLGATPADGFHLVNGFVEDGWTDGLLVAGLTADTGAPLLYVDTAVAPDATIAAVSSCDGNPVPLAVVGPTGRVDDGLRSSLDELDSDPC